jgi:predicted DsbA family dithiol-disulfide isomerase
MAVEVRYYTDPACPWSWALEPTVRRLMTEFGDGLSWTYVMGGLARNFAGDGDKQGVYSRLISHWLNVAEVGGMPLDPRIWTEGPIASSYPSCMAAKAAAEQALDGGYRFLREVREGLFCFRRKLDTTEALVETARVAGLDVERFRIDLASNAIVEAFGADLEEFRALEFELPTVVIGDRVVAGYSAYEEYRHAALAEGAVARDGPPVSVGDALRRFGRMATREVEEVCDLPGPRAPAELWRLALEWKVKPLRVLTGELWERP